MYLGEREAKLVNLGSNRIGGIACFTLDFQRQNLLAHFLIIDINKTLALLDTIGAEEVKEASGTLHRSGQGDLLDLVAGLVDIDGHLGVNEHRHIHHPVYNVVLLHIYVLAYLDEVTLLRRTGIVAPEPFYIG